MAVQRKTMTAEEFARLPSDNKFEELVRGEVRTSPPPQEPHGRGMYKISIRIGPFVEDHGLGKVFIDTGFWVQRDPDTVLAPDVSFISAERLAEPRAETYRFLVPDLVVEVVSPSETRRSVDRRMRDWLRFGARLGWAANPASRSLALYRPGADPERLEADDTVDGGDVLPGFRCRVAEFFD